jgi:HlyD family secretion protein
MQKNKVIIRLLQTKRFILAIIAALLVVGAIAALFGWRTAKSSSAGDLPTFTVKRGPLVISVPESGTIKPRDQVILKSEVEGKATILYLIKEGTVVKQKELLVELDASQLLDQKIDQQIMVQNAEAAFIKASEDLAVAENQAKSDVDKATLTLEFAGQDLKKYLEGDYPNKLKDTEAQITFAKAQLTRAQEKLKWSTRLCEEKYISQTELQTDQLDEMKTKLDLDVAQNNLRLLQDYTYKRQVAQFESDVNQAGMALERTQRKARADVVQAQALLKAKESEYGRQQDKLKKTEKNIEKATIRAPVDGVVVYATSVRSGGFRGGMQQAPLDEGQDVVERQELIYLPTALSVKAEIKVHESSLQKIKLGLPVRVTVDAVPGKTFIGQVGSIAPLPDAESSFFNPDLKVYTTNIYLDSDGNSLRTGMSCRAEIIVEQYKDAIYVPVQAVLRVGRQPTVYVVNGKIFAPREVEIGLDNGRMVRIVKGLQENEVVLLSPPLAAATVETVTGKGEPEITPIKTGKVEGETVEKSPAGQKPAPQGVPEAATGEGGSPPQGTELPSADQIQKIRERFESMPPEEQQKELEKMKQRFENMSPEEREQTRQRSQGAGGRRQGGRQGQGQSQNPERNQ